MSRLAERPTPVTGLSDPTRLRLRLPTVIRHPAVLEEARLIVTAKDGHTAQRFARGLFAPLTFERVLFTTSS
ncbi:hypothetical protein [Zavarzinia sp.]|uniref:hypothetical protein n=1 Tax=Zavarzinia sp. TaxID=2027920 RepID=UPI003BB6CB3E